jgi:hypothetical protein
MPNDSAVRVRGAVRRASSRPSYDAQSMKTFYQLLGVALLVVTTNNFVWFALTFWAYLATKSVITTSTLAGSFS